MTKSSSWCSRRMRRRRHVKAPSHQMSHPEPQSIVWSISPKSGSMIQSTIHTWTIPTTHRRIRKMTLLCTSRQWAHLYRLTWVSVTSPILPASILHRVFTQDQGCFTSLNILKSNCCLSPNYKQANLSSHSPCHSDRFCVKRKLKRASLLNNMWQRTILKRAHWTAQ